MHVSSYFLPSQIFSVFSTACLDWTQASRYPRSWSRKFHSQGRRFVITENILHTTKDRICTLPSPESNHDYVVIIIRSRIIRKTQTTPLYNYVTYTSKVDIEIAKLINITTSKDPQCCHSWMRRKRRHFYIAY